LESWQLLAPTSPAKLSPADYSEEVALAPKWMVAYKPAVTSSRQRRGSHGKCPRKKAHG
jgi:hypothetical protein